MAGSPLDAALRHGVDVNSPAAAALRAIQKLDEVMPFDFEARRLLIEAEDELGKLLGLACSGAREDVEVLAYDHAGGTCPVHEWLVEADSSDALAELAERTRSEAREVRPVARRQFYIAWTDAGVLGERIGHPFGTVERASARLDQILADPRSQIGGGWYLVVGPGSHVERAVGVGRMKDKPLPDLSRRGPGPA